MKPKLYIMKMRNARDYYDRKSIHFTVIDQDTKRKYPSNFICVLPQRISSRTGQTSIFAKTFGDQQMEIAEKLLTQALKTEKDTEIKTEINQRLKFLAPKPASPSRYIN
jgi:hypothetical protein